jgi:hypothetical protein
MLSSAEATAIAEETSTLLPDLEIFGQATLADYCGDFVLYRSLKPLDRRLPTIKRAMVEAGLSGANTPRKQDADYAKVAQVYAQAIHRLAGQNGEPTELLFIGDTLYNDGGAFRNMADQGEWRGACFIGVEAANEEPAVSVQDGIYLANRWEALADWARWLREEHGFQLNHNTVVIVDIDKTALGARGRNDKAIDKARLEGAYNALSKAIGADIVMQEFVVYYSELNQAKYHGLTADNQDYLAYLCLVISSGLISFDEIKQEVADGSLTSFEQFMRLVETRMLINTGRSEGLRQAHDAITASMRTGDPTPFKSFRRQEFVSTVAHMGQYADDTPVQELLGSEITLTEEVCGLMSWLGERGGVVLCLSDKPDEASTPDPRRTPDVPPVHRKPTHRVGINIRPLLDEIE